MDFAAVKREIDMVERGYAQKGFGDRRASRSGVPTADAASFAAMAFFRLRFAKGYPGRQRPG
ncbi:hypothetical protein HED48_10645 [Ochrobactrum intermedium]|nr:hypothetical protein [Brucella intermedia]